MVVRIAGETVYLWRAVDHEGEVLDVLVQRRRDKRAALNRSFYLSARKAESVQRIG
jgi:transposase-like protein